jgi:hypothetical protein
MKPAARQILINASLILGSMLLSLLIIQVILAAFPQLQPDTLVFTVGMQDIYFHHPEWVKRPENPDEVLSIHRLAYDQEGFRMPARPSSSYEILALGDSFTEAANVALPWSDVLAAASGRSVRNLGFRGYGPVEITHMIERYGQAQASEILIVGFFEGNDLNNVEASQGKPMQFPSEIEVPEFTPIDFEKVDQSNTRYPLTILMGTASYPIAFFEWYVWNLNVTPQDIASSLEMALLRTEFERMQAASTGKCLILAYFPSKPHIYLPFLDEASQQVLLQNSHQRQPDQSMNLRNVATPDLTFAQLLARLDNQRDAIRSLAASLGIHFFDTTTLAQQAAAAGELLYYQTDTHWNQRGHTIAGEALADYIATDICVR